MPKASRTWNCLSCTSNFATKGDLRRHEDCHAPMRRYECTLCPKRFSQMSALNTHHNTHTKQKPYGCEQCTSSFGDPSSRSRHRHEMHSGFVGYFCPGCPKSMKRSKNFKMHLEKCDSVTKYNANIRVYMVYDESSADFKEYFKNRKPPREARIVMGDSKKAVIVSEPPAANSSPSPPATKKAPSVTAELSSIGRARRMKTLQRAHPYKDSLQRRRRASEEETAPADLPADMLQQPAVYHHTISTVVEPLAPTDDEFYYVPVDASYGMLDDGIAAEVRAQDPSMVLPGSVAGPSNNPQAAFTMYGLSPLDVPQIPGESTLMIPSLVYGQWAGDIPSYTDAGVTYQAPISPQWGYQGYNIDQGHLYGMHGTQVTARDDYSDLFETITTTPTEAINAALQCLNTQPQYWSPNVPTLPAVDTTSPYSPYSDALSPLSDLTPSPGGSAYSNPGTPAEYSPTIGSRGPSPQSEAAFSLYRPPSSRPQYSI